MVVDIDRGSVVLITTDALIEKPSFVYPPGVRFTRTQLFVGVQGSLRITFLRGISFRWWFFLPCASYRLSILSNGQPIDIITVVGTTPVTSEPGNVMVNIAPGVSPL